MTLKIVFIAGNGPSKKKLDHKLTKREILHIEAVATIAARRIQDRANAKKMFAPEREKLNQLRQKLNDLKKKAN